MNQPETAAPATKTPAASTAGSATRPTVKRDAFIACYAAVALGLKHKTLELAENEVGLSGTQIVAQRLELAETSVQQRATTYRTKRGIPLPNMPRTGGGAKFDTEAGNAALNAVLAQFETPADKPAETETPAS